MKTGKCFLIFSLLGVIVLLILPGKHAYANTTSLSDHELAQKFAPVLYFHPTELFRPQSVDAFVNTSRLREQRRFWFDINVLPKVLISDLLDFRGEHYFLDAWYGSEGTSDSMNYSSHRSYYENHLQPGSGDNHLVAYAHVVRDEVPGFITIQYWLFYYYNDWFNKHEGDWEMGEVILNEKGDPEWVILSQHHGGTRRPWSMVSIEHDTHPAIYVALGSHANYFWGNEIYPNGIDIGNARVEIMDRTGTVGQVIPDVKLIPDPKIVADDTQNWFEWGWVLFGGHWGETSYQSDFGGPYGPAYKGEQWESPHKWGMSQPLDVETWYANRLRVAVKGKAAHVSLKSSNHEVSSSSESVGDVALLHRDPFLGEVITAEIEITPNQPFQITATWPEFSTSQVITYKFDELTASPSGFVTLTLSESEPPALKITGVLKNISPSVMESKPRTWDSPDLVWLAGFLPSSEVIKGLIICLLAGWLPTSLLIGVLYWSDRYEKEPASLLVAAFLWGAVPALLIAIVARLFFRLPPELLGSKAVGAIWSGSVEPLVEETLKGLVVLLIAVRYRREFDNILDGIIYGGVVGIGFAMNANIISYIGSFLTRGYTGLSVLIFLEGILYGLNHALYTAIFGAGMGYARLSRRSWQRWGIPIAAYLFAVLSHASHNLVMRNSIGLNLGNVLLTLVGVLAITILVGWSLRRQHRCLEVELMDELPEDLYQIVVRPVRRVQAQWRTYRNEGFLALRRSQQLYQLCAEFAFKRMQARLFPNEENIRAEAHELRDEIRALSEKVRII